MSLHGFFSSFLRALYWTRRKLRPLSGIEIRKQISQDTECTGGEVNTAASSLNVGNVTNYSITSLAAGKSYFFYVSAVNTAGLESLPSASLIYSVPVSMPAAPSNLAGIAQSSTQVMLTWRDNSTNETGFQILRKTGASGSYLTNTVAGEHALIYEFRAGRRHAVFLQGASIQQRWSFCLFQ